jgi:hypothetical protein
MYNMNGIYKVFIDGELVAEQKNKLTLLGRSNALKTMLGLVPSFAGSMGIGISGLGNTSSGRYETRTDLDFSVGRYPIIAASLGQAPLDEDILVYTARVTDPSRYSIRELGLYANKLSSNFESDNTVLFNFESGDPLKETISSVDYYVDDPNKPTGLATIINTTTETFGPYIRLGNYALKLTGTSGVFFNDSVIDMSYVAPYDQFVLAAHFTDDVVLNIKFSDGATTATYGFDPSGTGYKVLSMQKNEVSGYASLDWSNITSVTFDNVSSATTVIDGLRVKRYRTVDSVEGLVSRAVLATAIEKPEGSIVDIQYLLEMGLVM